MNAKEIRKEIKELKAEMKNNGIKTTSCFNGGLTNDERYYNQKLFSLKCDLEKCK